MAGLGHLAFGFAAKPIVPRMHLVVLLFTSELIDILWGIFYFNGIDSGNTDSNSFPWSHSLFMSLIWSFLAAVIFGIIYHDNRSGIIIGLIVFSHWIIDFITHPMGAIFGGTPLPPDLPLFFNSSHNVGLGFYNHSFTLAIATDLGMLLIGVVIYLLHRIKLLKQEKF
jgi:hypothetical protein